MLWLICGDVCLEPGLELPGGGGEQLPLAFGTAGVFVGGQSLEQVLAASDVLHHRLQPRHVPEVTARPVGVQQHRRALRDHVVVGGDEVAVVDGDGPVGQPGDVDDLGIPEHHRLATQVRVGDERAPLAQRVQPGLDCLKAVLDEAEGELRRGLHCG
ncbi:MAG: hypothetical protein ACYC8T_19365, partial [Myxococcaceae bacterium]